MSDASASLRASLAEQLRVLYGEPPPALLDAVVERLDAPAGPLTRVRPRSFDAVREAEALAGPSRPTPYWASAWPSGTLLTRAVAAEELGGLRVLEIGCGLGMPSVAAARAGAIVMASDASPAAVVYAAHNLALNGQLGDVAAAAWPDLAETCPEPFDLVLAADVLYTRDNADTLARLLPSLVAPGGEAWIADPGRSGARDFLAVARHTWSIDSGRDAQAPVRVHRLARS